MNAREWKPGDVAMVTWSAMGELRTDIRFRCYRRALGGHVWESPDGTWIGDASAKNVRPLVVIDPEDREQVERLDAAYQSALDNAPRFHGLEYVMQAALRSLIAPPKPEEPQGLGAVVEDEGGVPWVRCENADREPHWYARNKMRAYADITAVRVLSEGVTA